MTPGVAPAAPLPQAVAAPKYSVPLAGELNAGKGAEEMPLPTRDQVALAPALNSSRATSALLIVPFHAIDSVVGDVEDTWPYQICNICPSLPSKKGRAAGCHDVTSPPETAVTWSAQVSLMMARTIGRPGKPDGPSRRMSWHPDSRRGAEENPRPR